MIIQSALDLAEICAQQGIKKAILSPGSRCAPLSLAFIRHPKITTYTFSDERSAAFVALGMAESLNEAVVLVCTSGSAALNYAPAIAEAFYRHIPLLVLTADRPPEWIDQLDGQTIRQKNIYANHIRYQAELPVGNTDNDRWYSQRLTNEAIQHCLSAPRGPVHLNCPFREPFYPSTDGKQIEVEVKTIKRTSAEPHLAASEMEALNTEFCNYKNILLVIGQQSNDPELKAVIENFMSHNQVVVISDVIGNMNDLPHVITKHDIILSGINIDHLQPDLVISIGQSVLSKGLKKFFRQAKPAHWHIAVNDAAADTFQSLTHHIPVDPTYLLPLLKGKTTDKKFVEHWASAQQKATDFLKDFKIPEFGEFEAIRQILKQLPSASFLHLANSMSVRYVNYFGLVNKNISVRANRGTSGIDGSNSTAMGDALVNDTLTTLITGDMAFFYDRNAFWHNYNYPNLRIIVLNNHGGGIFRLIDGPSEQPELEEYFETRQSLKAANTAQDFGLEYVYCTTEQELNEKLSSFFRNDGKAKILEIDTDKFINQRVFTLFKQHISKLSYGQ